jgi:hypothetical protein
MIRHSVCLLVLPLLLSVTGLGALASVAAAQAAPGVAPESDDTEARYQTTVENAVREFGMSNWAEARALFRRAHALKASARTWRGMGMAAFELKLYVEALRELTAALAEKQNPLTEDQSRQVQGLIEQSKAFVGRYRVVLSPETAKAKIDGQDAWLDPGNVLILSLGDHELTANAEGHQELRMSLRVEGGEDNELKLELSKTDAAPLAAAPLAAPAQAPAPAHSNGDGSTATTIGWVAAAGAVVFAGGSAAFWFIGDSNYSKLEDLCGPDSCTQQQIDDSGVGTADTLHLVFMGLAGAAAITSVVAFVVGGSGDEQPPSAATARLNIGPGSVQLQGSF